jgi:hypothetical protein
MKFIKYSFLIVIIGSFASCLKPKNDFAGLRDDNGSIVVSIAEAQYLSADVQNIGYHFSAFTNFNFAAPATEEVKFFTLHVSQPRETKMSGPITAKITMTPLAGFTAPPANSITIADVSIPASNAASFDFPVKFNVNKAALNPANHYGATFTISSVSQGVAGKLDGTVDVIFNEEHPDNGTLFNNSRFVGRYQWTSTVTDPAGQYGITNNKKPVNLHENVAGRLDVFDFGAWALSAATTFPFLWANNLATGANTALFAPRYVLDANGKVTAIVNQSATAAVTNITLDASGANQFTYTSNDNRKLEVKYSFSLTTTINGAPVTRTVTVSEKYEYDMIQAFF